MSLGNGLVAGWADEIAIFCYVKNTGNESPGTNSTGEGTLAQQMLTALYSLKENESIASVADFKSLAAEKGDIKFWTNPASGFNNISALKITKFSELLNGAHSSGTVNFEDEKVVADFKSYAGKEVADMIKKYPSPASDFSLVEKYPGNVQGFLSFSFNPQLINEVIKYAGADALLGNVLSNLGFTLDDVLKMFKGNINIIYGGVASGGSKTPAKTKMLFVASIADKASYQKVASAMASKNWLVQQGNFYTSPIISGQGAAMMLNEKKLVIASDSVLLQDYLNGNTSISLPAEVQSMAKDKPMTLFVDIQKY